jgi:hypothetical protein
MMHSLVVLLSVWNLFGLLPGDKVELRDLACAYQDKNLVVRCRLTGVDGTALRQALESGETVLFDYQVELRRERGIWFDEFVEEFHYQKKLSFDTLTRQYFATSEFDSRRGEAIIMDDPDKAVGWLSSLERWEIPVLLANKDEKTYIRTRVVLRRRKLLLVIPFETSTSWQRTPVSVP